MGGGVVHGNITHEHTDRRELLTGYKVSDVTGLVSHGAATDACHPVFSWKKSVDIF